MTDSRSKEPSEYIQELIDESMEQFYRSRLRAKAIEVFAYISGVLWGIASFACLVISTRLSEDRSYIIFAVFLAFVAIMTFFTISAFAHLLGNSTQQLRLAAFEFILAHDPYDPESPN
jgi:fatty-acid desaturase